MTTKTKRPLFIHLADGTPVYCVTKDGQALSAWYSFDSTQPGPAEYSCDARDFDARQVLDLDPYGAPDPEDVAALLALLTAAELQQRSEDTSRG